MFNPSGASVYAPLLKPEGHCSRETSKIATARDGGLLKGNIYLLGIIE